MKRAACFVLSLVLGVILLGAVQKPVRANLPSAAPLPRHVGIAAGTIAKALTIVAAAPVSAPARGDDRDEIRRKLRDGGPGTYIDDILLERDSSLARWADRNGIPLTVWIQPRSSVRDFTTSYVARVKSAFQAWDALNLPVRFSFVEDSAEAEVHVNWIDHFNQPISGRTRWARDDDWIITDANIVLAVHHQGGEQLDEDAMRAMAMHEIGHLLGLDHTADSLSIMAPKVRVRELSGRDCATVRLLYALPSGPVR